MSNLKFTIMKGFIQVTDLHNQTFLISVNHIFKVYTFRGTEACICIDQKGDNNDPYYKLVVTQSYKDVIKLIEEAL